MLEEQHDPIIDQCLGCSRVIPDKENSEKLICKAYLFPKAKWRFQHCPLANHLEKKVAKVEMVDPLKASKKSRKKRK